MNTTRKAFEAWVTAEPREWDIYRWGDHCAHPGNYCDDNVQCAWEAWQAACAAEREACAKMCEYIYTPSRLSDPGRSWITGTLDCAAAIRARGE